MARHAPSLINVPQTTTAVPTHAAVPLEPVLVILATFWVLMGRVVVTSTNVKPTTAVATPMLPVRIMMAASPVVATLDLLVMAIAVPTSTNAQMAPIIATPMLLVRIPSVALPAHAIQDIQGTAYLAR